MWAIMNHFNPLKRNTCVSILCVYGIPNKSLGAIAPQASVKCCNVTRSLLGHTFLGFHIHLLWRARTSFAAHSAQLLLPKIRTRKCSDARNSVNSSARRGVKFLKFRLKFWNKNSKTRHFFKKSTSAPTWDIRGPKSKRSFTVASVVRRLISINMNLWKRSK